jgi:hypothetical protein
MGTGYTRNDTTNNISDGGIIDASDLDGEFDALVSAFNETTGHTHDGTASEGGAVSVVGPAQDFVAGASDFSPKTDSAYTLGKVATRWSTGYLDDLDLTNALPIAQGGSGATSAGGARTAFGVVIGTDVQAYTTVLANTTASFLTTDESKLDGIEALADVTDATNVTAAGALMDSELTSITDVKALDQSVVSGATPTFGIANMTLSDTSLVVSDTTNMQTFADGVDSALLRARGTGFTSTYVSTAAVGGTTFAQPAVNGEIYSDQGYFAITYAGATGITVATLTAPSTYVYIDNAGNLQQQTSTPTRQDWSRKMFTMRIAVDTVAETILGFEYLGNPIGHYANSIRDIYQALLAQGVPFKGGQVITGRAGDLGFDVGAGTITEFGGTGDINNANVLSLDAAANVTYSLLDRTAVIGDQTNLVKFWDNAGSITALGSGTFVAHRLYRFSNGTFAMQYGQGNYANIVLARSGLLIEDYVLNERLRNATFFGWWILGETAINTGGTTLTEFREYTIGVQGGSSSGLAGCLLRGNNLSDLLDVGAAQVSLDLEPGVDVQAYAAVLANTTASFLTADETKLNNIEALADVTDVTNVTAAGALMDSEVTNLAQVKAFDGADYATAAQGSTADTALQSGDIGSTVQGYDADTLKADATANLTAAYTAAIDDDGTITTGTYTPTTAAGSNYKKIIGGGAFTLAPPVAATDTATTLSLFIVNNASAGAITTSGFTKVAGDDFTTTNAHKFSCRIEVNDIGGTEYSTLVVLAMQ